MRVPVPATWKRDYTFFALATVMAPMDWSPPSLSSSGIALLLVSLVVLAAVPGVAAAESRAGGTIVVGEGETINEDLEAFGGDIVVRGTVNGDVSAFGGNVRIEGEVTGDVNAFAGNVWISGDVGGSVESAGGNVYVQPEAEIGGNLEAAAGNVVVAGTVRGSAELAGGTVTLAESATIDGDVEYGVESEEDFRNEGATVGGTVDRAEDVDAGPWEGPQIPGWVFGIYGFFVNLLLGAVLLLALPGFSAAVAGRVADDPLRTAGVGLLALVGIPVLLVLLVVSIVGIPIALVGALLLALLLWVALVYGRFAIGAWLLSLADVENRWLALVVGLLLFGIASRLPWVGGLIDFVVVLLGLGAVVALAYVGYRGRGA